MKIAKLVLLLSILIFVGCCKNNNNISPSNLLDGKLKSFSFIDDTSLFNYTFHYDSITSDLVVVKFNDSTIFTIEKQGTDKIKIIEHLTNNNYLLTRNSIKQITSIELVDNNNQLISSYLDIAINNNIIDTIHQTTFEIPSWFSYKNIESNNFKYQNGNCVASSMRYDFGQGSFMPTYTEHNDTFNFQYSSILNTNNIFGQIPFYNLPTYLNYVDMIYVAQLANFYIAQPNKNLVSYKEMIFVPLATKTAHTFNYLLDSENRVTQMDIQQVGENNNISFTFKYY